uniref:Uncharacterized protein n=1 Tax=Anguilla anguilla TaxID=7936 RepID=A0A0E9WAW8_ANGAN
MSLTWNLISQSHIRQQPLKWPSQNWMARQPRCIGEGRFVLLTTSSPCGPGMCRSLGWLT